MDIVVEVLSQLETLTITKEALEVKTLFVIKIDCKFRLNLMTCKLTISTTYDLNILGHQIRQTRE